MAFSITQFQNNITNQLSALDNNFSTFGALVPIPGSIAGTNVLAFTQNAAGLVPTPSIAAYNTGMLFTGIATGSNSQATTFQAGSLPVINVYKDTTSGPALLVGGEIVNGNAISFLYDSALNSGAGGVHLIASTSITRTQFDVLSLRIGNNFTSTLTNLLSGTVALTFTATPGWSSQDQSFTLTGLPPTVPAPGDFVQIVPASLGATGVSYQGMVTALGSLSSVASVATVNIRLLNGASASLASNSGVYRYMALRTVP